MKNKICFVALSSYPLLSSNRDLKYGSGAELKQVLLASEIIKRSFDITFITYKEKGAIKRRFRDISIIKTFNPTKKIKNIKKLIILWHCLKKANAGVYIQATQPPLVAAFFCFIYRKKYIKWMSNDRTVLLDGISNIGMVIERISQFIDIKLSSFIISQNNFQKHILEKKFKKKCIKIKNPAIPPSKNNNKDYDKENLILWIGGIRNIKQPDLCLEIAKQIPNCKFIMIGERINSELELYHKIEREAEKMSNVEFLNFIPHDEIHKFYKKSSIFVNTSRGEGFPNTFLEAWMNYTPVVSLNVNPDGIIDRYSLGYHSKNFNRLVKDIQSLLDNNELRRTMGANGRRYVENEHDVKKIGEKFEKLFNKIRREQYNNK